MSMQVTRDLVEEEDCLRLLQARVMSGVSLKCADWHRLDMNSEVSGVVGHMSKETCAVSRVSHRNFSFASVCIFGH